MTYAFTSDISEWLAENAREIAVHLWCPNLESGWKAWLYVQDGEIKCSYNTQNTTPHPDESGDFFITAIWNDIDDGDSPFDDDYDQVDYIADYIFNGGLDPIEA